MVAILQALINLATVTGAYTVAQATEWYNRMWYVLFTVLIGCALAFYMNAGHGVLWFSLVLAMITSVFIAFIWARPLYVLIIVGGFGLFNRVIGDPTLAARMEEVLVSYVKLLKSLLLVSTTFLFIMGTISFEGRPADAMPIVVGMMVVWLFTWMWPDLFSGVWGKRIVYGYAVLIVVLSFVGLIPGPLWTKYMGFDPVTLKASKTDEALYRLDTAERDAIDAANSAAIDSITNKITAGTPLADEEIAFLARVRSATKPAEKSGDGVFKMLPYGASREIDPPPFTAVRFLDSTGTYTAHYRYADGRTGTVGDPNSPRSDGNIVAVWVKDVSGRANSVVYELVRP